MTELPALLEGAVELRVPADPCQLSLARMLAEGVAVRADFDLDATADVKMAVDEACTALIDIARPGAVIECRLWTLGDELHVSVSTTTPDGKTPDMTSFGWYLLTSLASVVSTRVEPAWDNGPPVTRIEFTHYAHLL